MRTQRTRWPEISRGMIVGFLVGLPIAAMLAGFVAWASMQRRAQELAEDYRQFQVVIVTETILAGEPLDGAKVARRPVPAMVVSGNTVSPDEINDLFGKAPTIRFEPGDLLLRSAFGLEPRQPAADEDDETQDPEEAGSGG